MDGKKSEPKGLAKVVQKPLSSMPKCYGDLVPYAWIYLDMYLAFSSAVLIFELIQGIHAFKSPSGFPWGYAFFVGYVGAANMAFVAMPVRWRKLSNFNGIPRAAVHCLVYSPWTLLLVFPTAFLGMFFKDLPSAACVLWIDMVVLAIFLTWCVSLNRDHSKNSLAGLTVGGKSCETDDEFHRLASIC